MTEVSDHIHRIKRVFESKEGRINREEHEAVCRRIADFATHQKNGVVGDPAIDWTNVRSYDKKGTGVDWQKDQYAKDGVVVVTTFIKNDRFGEFKLPPIYFAVGGDINLSLYRHDAETTLQSLDVDKHVLENTFKMDLSQSDLKDALMVKDDDELREEITLWMPGSSKKEKKKNPPRRQTLKWKELFRSRKPQPIPIPVDR